MTKRNSFVGPAPIQSIIESYRVRGSLSPSDVAFAGKSTWLAICGVADERGETSVRASIINTWVGAPPATKDLEPGRRRKKKLVAMLEATAPGLGGLDRLIYVVEVDEVRRFFRG